MKALSTSEIDEYMKGVKGYTYTRPKDKVKPLRNGQSVCFNLESSGESGSHWVCLYRDKTGKYIYFDSYGGTPPKNVYEILEGNCIMNSYQIQPLDNVSVMCGYYCTMILNEVHKGTSFEDIIYIFGEDKNRNDKLCGRYIKTNF
jgi:hypothetical protein